MQGRKAFSKEIGTISSWSIGIPMILTSSTLEVFSSGTEMEAYLDQLSRRCWVGQKLIGMSRFCANDRFLFFLADQFSRRRSVLFYTYQWGFTKKKLGKQSKGNSLQRSISDIICDQGFGLLDLELLKIFHGLKPWAAKLFKILLLRWRIFKGLPWIVFCFFCISGHHFQLCCDSREICKLCLPPLEVGSAKPNECKTAIFMNQSITCRKRHFRHFFLYFAFSGCSAAWRDGPKSADIELPNAP